MKIVGISYTTNSSGEILTTLHVETDFEPYYRNPESGRNCFGVRTENVYVGNFDVSALEVGMSVEISYGKALQTKHSIYQPIKSIVVIE